MKATHDPSLQTSGNVGRIWNYFPSKFPNNTWIYVGFVYDYTNGI